MISSGAPKVSSAPKPRPNGGHGHAGAGRPSGGHAAGGRETGRANGRGGRASASRDTASRHGSGAIRVRHLARGADDGYQSPLVPGLKSSEDADRLAQEIAFAAWRLEQLEFDPPGLCAEVAAGSLDLEERTWLGFLIAYFGPLESDRPFAWIESVRTTWASGALPDLEDAVVGPRGIHELDRGTVTLGSYRAWAMRAGSQASAFTGEPAWTPERRFARAFERLALPGMHRDGRFDLLVLLGRLGCYEMRAGTLALGGENEVTVAAKRALGIGDTMLLERRASELAAACAVPLEALDLGLHNWGVGRRVGAGVDAQPDLEAGEDVLASARAALGCS